MFYHFFNRNNSYTTLHHCKLIQLVDSIIEAYTPSSVIVHYVYTFYSPKRMRITVA